MAQSNKTRLINQILRNQLQQGGVKPTVTPQPQQNQFVLSAGGTNYDSYDLSIVEYIYNNAVDTSDFNNLNEFLDARTYWWPNGRIAGLNAQGTINTGFKLQGDNALPLNIGDLTELWYLDIGLKNDLTLLPESIGNLFHHSIYELADRNGGWNQTTNALLSFEECRQEYNNLKLFPDSNYDWNKISKYSNIDCSGYIVNLHLDGNDNLGRVGTIPDSIQNWSHLDTLYFGIGANISSDEFEFPDIGFGWKNMKTLFKTGTWLHNLGTTHCQHIPNHPSIDFMNYEGPYWFILFGSDWIGIENCEEYWSSIQQTNLKRDRDNIIT